MDVLLTERPFVPCGVSHWAALLVFAAGAILLVRLGRAQRGTVAARRFSQSFAALVFVFPLPLVIYALLPRQWSLAHSLPLQLCDLAWMTTVYALWTRRAWAYALTYYWGLTLTSQALLTPALALDFPHAQFILFWAMHLLIVWAAIYLTWGLGLKPDWRSYRFTVAATMCWALSMLLFNSVFDTNYGFLNEKPPVKSLLDLLGVWPWYLLSELMLVLTVWALMTWPWVRRTIPPPEG